MKRKVIGESTIRVSIWVVCMLLAIGKCQFQTCQDIVEDWIENPEHLPAGVFMNSGKFLNDLGDYDDCVGHPQDYIYVMMAVVNKMTNSYQYMGLCAPVECKQFLVSNAETANIENTLNEAFRNATKAEFSPFMDMKFYAPQQVEPQMDWTNYLTMALFTALIVLGILGSFLSKTAPNSKSVPVKAIKAFSLVDNFSKIITIPTSVENENLLFLNGVRVLSIFWIVYGHDMWFRFMNIRNWMDSISLLTTAGAATLAPAAYFAVDTFFWIGGFLITIGMLEQMMKKKIGFLKFYIGCVVHRFIRIWPTYMIAILMFWKIAPYFGSGPLWNIFSNFACQCDDGGVLWNMFFVDNFGDHGPSGMQYCFGWGWYLAVDFQLFMITPFIFFAYKKNKKLGWLLTFLLFLGSVVTAFVMIMVNEWRYPIPNAKLKPQPEFMDKFYYKPYVRASAYFMGIFSGFVYYEWKNKNERYVRVITAIKNSVPIRVAFYVVGFGLTQFIVWIIVPYQTGSEWSQLAQGLYNSLNRVVFLIGFYLCIFAAMFGCKNDPPKFILGHPFFSPLAKVSFCIYLTHFIVIMNGAFSARTNLYWQPFSCIYIIITDIFFSVFLALTLSLLVESPTLGLQKIFLRGGGKKKSDSSQKEHNNKDKEAQQKEIQNMSKSYTYSFKDDGSEIKQGLLSDKSDSSDSKSNIREPLL